MKKALTIFGLMMLAVLIYLCTQQPRLKLNHQMFGLILMKGGYRSWTLSFCEGDQLGPNGSIQAHMWGDDLHSRWRIIPTFRHVDMRHYLILKGLKADDFDAGKTNANVLYELLREAAEAEKAVVLPQGTYWIDNTDEVGGTNRIKPNKP